MKSLVSRVISYFIFSCLFISCGGDDFTEQSKLSNLRVLAITADSPEINSAATVTLTPLISYVNGAGASLNYSWEACPDPGIDFGAELNCDSSIVPLKVSGSGSFDTSTLASSYFTGNATNIAVNISSDVFTYLATTTSDIQFNGLDYLVFITYADATTSESIKALKRIKLSSKTGGELNLNPTMGSIQVDDSNLSAYPISKSSMTLSTLSPPETYSKQTNIGQQSFTEDMYISWYASSGDYLFNRTDIGEANTYTPSGSTGVFVIVYRDGRGGVATEQVSF